MYASGNNCFFIEVEIAQQSFINYSQRSGLIKNCSSCSQTVKIKSISEFQMQIAFRTEEASYFFFCDIMFGRSTSTYSIFESLVISSPRGERPVANSNTCCTEFSTRSRLTSL